MRLTAIALMLAATAARVEAGDCVDTGLVAEVLTPANATIDQDGGVVVGLVDDPTSRTIPNLQKPWWVFDGGRTSTSAQVITLAPGLAILVPRSDVGTSLQLVDDQKRPRVHVTFEHASYDDRPLDAAPKPTRATYTETTSRHASTQATTLGLATPVPANAVAMIAYGKTGNQPRSWARVTPGATSVVIWHAETCHGEAKGTVGSPAASELVVVYVNSRGHTSLPSTPITVKHP